jgi:hypothetical protein
MREVTIVFKGGISQTFKAENVKTSRNGFGDLLELSWENASGNIPLYISLGQIAAVFIKGDE